MKKNNVDYATIVSAQIWKNPENNIYIKSSLKKYKNLFQFFDFDSYWSDSYQSKNADKRLSKICHDNKLIGITQYLGDDDAKWLYSKEGEKLFDLIANEKSTAEVCEAIGADKLIYQDLEDLVYAVQAGNEDIKKFETSVFTGEYLTDVGEKYFQDLEKKRHST